MALINEQELFDCFLFDKYPYGKNLPHWPRRTILLCHCTATNQTGQTIILTGSILGSQWQRFDNGFLCGNKVHAESKMVDFIKGQMTQTHMNNVRLFVTLSYSPCIECARKIIEFKTWLQNNSKVCTIDIKFSNFYRCSNTIATNNQLGGLCELVCNGITLGIFYGFDDWIRFINLVLGLPMKDYVSINIVSYARQEREYIDFCIIHCIYTYSLTMPGNPAVDLLSVARATTVAEADVAVKNFNYQLPIVTLQSPYVLSCPSPVNWVFPPA